LNNYKRLRAVLENLREELRKYSARMSTSRVLKLLKTDKVPASRNGRGHFPIRILVEDIRNLKAELELYRPKLAHKYLKTIHDVCPELTE